MLPDKASSQKADFCEVYYTEQGYGSEFTRLFYLKEGADKQPFLHREQSSCRFFQEHDK